MPLIARNKFTLAVLALILSVFSLSSVQAQSDNHDGSKNRYFRGLENALSFYASIAESGGWPSLPEGGSLKPGVSDPRITILRKRLSVTGDFIGEDLQSDVYDDELKQAVIAYQNRNGQEPDGVVGAATTESLNIAVEDRILLLQINRDRWGQMPASLGQKFVLVNMAGFELDVIDGDNTTLSMRVIVGNDYNSTPMFSDMIRSIEVNPYWNVPESIASKELAGTFAKGTSVAEADGYEIVRDGKPLPLNSVDWAPLENQPVPFAIRQKPGPKNVLGQFKFLFPNKYNVYLHDTNARSLFEKTVRTFSHGCVRLQQPRRLADNLLAGDPEWTAERIDEVLASGVNTNVKLQTPVPVHLAYMTAWVDSQGFIQFRPDIYGRDTGLENHK